MSKTLLEANFQTTDLRAIYTRKINTSPEASTEIKNSSSSLEAKLLELGFKEDIIKKLISLGELFKKACEILGFNKNKENGGNPILAFVAQPYVQERLINTNLLNASTFKAIYNAVAKKLVADSEFFETRNYNIIYCPDLYRKSAKEMEDYLILQRSILSPSERKYDGQTQLKNRQVFLHIDVIKNSEGKSELDPDKYSAKAKTVELDDTKLPKVTSAELNSLAVAKKINGSGSPEEPTTVIKSETELAKIVEKLTTTADKLAAILALSTSTNSTHAQQALASSVFEGVSGDLVTKAFLRLSKSDILPKGQLSTKTADTLVDLIVATFKPEEPK